MLYEYNFETDEFQLFEFVTTSLIALENGRLTSFHRNR